MAICLFFAFGLNLSFHLFSKLRVKEVCEIQTIFNSLLNNKILDFLILRVLQGNVIQYMYMEFDFEDKGND